MSYGPPPQPAPRSRRKWLIVLLVVALLCCGGSLGGGYLIVKKVLDMGAPARDATTEFLTAVRDGDEVTAYDQLCDRVRRSYTRDEFRRAVQNQLGDVTDFRLTGFTVETTNGTTTGTVTAQLTEADGSTHSVEFQLSEEHGTWRVCGDPF
jgi:hypothetical protein